MSKFPHAGAFLRPRRNPKSLFYLIYEILADIVTGLERILHWPHVLTEILIQT